jgi:polyisoprenoid-binding protein YceI
MYKHLNKNYMKKISLMMALMFIGWTAMATNKKTESYKVDATKSTIVWTAKKVTGQHTGNVNITNGQLSVNGDKISTGSFTVDMNSINVTDLQGEWKDKLQGHLASEDFFNVSKNPTSSLEITKVRTEGDRTIIDGELTIKGIKKPISFPASVSKKGNVVVAIATIKVDRTKYDIKYGSKSFFEGIGDKAIDDEFELQVNLVAIK